MEIYGPDRGSYATRVDKGTKRRHDHDHVADVGISEAAWLHKRTKTIDMAVAQRVQHPAHIEDQLADIAVEERC